MRLILFVREKRTEKGLSVRVLGKKADVNYGYISQIENGHSVPSLLVMCKLAKALEVSVEDLFIYR